MADSETPYEFLEEFDKAFTAHLTLLARCVHDTHVRKGFHQPAKSVPHLLGMVMTELAEVVEDDRNGRSGDASSKIPGHTNMEEEVADAILRLLDFAALHDLRIGEATLAKARYNEGRERLHGKRY